MEIAHSLAWCSDFVAEYRCTDACDVAVNNAKDNPRPIRPQTV